ncbi:molybdenum cofactor biosynthesis protein B [Fibrobacterota bacterium]
MIKALVLTISDRASKWIYEDKSGPAIEHILKTGIQDVEITRSMVSDDPKEIEGAFILNLSMDFIITTGGTGIGPRDNTPEVTENFCDRLLPGIPEFLRMESCRQTTHAVLSRAVAGVSGKTIIINLPGSERGARFCAGLLVPVLPHAKKMLEGGGH